MKKRSSILIYILIVIGFTLILTNSCKKDTTTTTPAITVTNTEVWKYVIDTNVNDTANLTHIKKSDGSITTSGAWNYIYQSQLVVCLIKNTVLTVNDTTYSFTATGTATNSSAPASISTSPFTLAVNGITHNGTSTETYDIYFTQYLWPSHKSGFSIGTRVSGGGITK